MNVTYLLSLIHAGGALAVVIAAALGIILVVTGFVRLRQHAGHGRAGPKPSTMGTVMTFVPAILLVYLVTFAQLAHETVFVSDGSFIHSEHSPMTWQQGPVFSDGGHDELALRARLIVDAIALVGALFLIKGVFKLRLVNEHARPGDGTLAKAFGHILGGILLIDIIRATELVGEVFFFFEDVAEFLKRGRA